MKIFRELQRPAARPGLQLLQLLQRVWREDPNAGSGSDALPPTEAAVLNRAVIAPRRVMVVDDNPVNLMLASELLMSMGVQPLTAGDGAEAVALADEWPLELILMDLQMPVLDGLGATRQIRANETSHGRARVPVVAYSTRAPALPVLQGFGLDDTLDKPCAHDALRGCLQRWCPQVLKHAPSIPAAALHAANLSSHGHAQRDGAQIGWR